MKAVMISIKPKWCEKIANGNKTIEVRKTRPKIDTPFKCYIYCTYGNMKENYCLGMRGKVIGEFVCDRIDYVRNYGDCVDYYDCVASCLTASEIIDYATDKNGKFVYTYGWHISDLVIYDKPKELSEFEHDCNGICLDFEKGIVCEKAGIICNGLSPLTRLTRPPQSWCYVEEKEKDNEQRRNEND